MDNPENNMHNHHRSHRLWFGLLVITTGVVILLERMQMLMIPDWVMSWPTLLIVWGLIMAIRHRFRSFFPYLLILLGSGFLYKKLYGFPEDVQTYVWPLFIILFGLMILFKPRRKPICKPKEWQPGHHLRDNEHPVKEQEHNKVDIMAVFCGINRNIVSKDFAGGEITAVFGGTELNLTHADFAQTAVIDVSIVFGGLKLIVPSNWDVQLNVSNVAAGIDDRRTQQGGKGILPEKILILTGNVTFGGIDIRSFD